MQIGDRVPYRKLHTSRTDEPDGFRYGRVVSCDGEMACIDGGADGLYYLEVRKIRRMIREENEIDS